jgi:hypothetical protein
MNKQPDRRWSFFKFNGGQVVQFRTVANQDQAHLGADLQDRRTSRRLLLSSSFTGKQCFSLLYHSLNKFSINVY